MKRFWLGVLLMALLLGLGIFTDIAMDRLHTPLSRDLEQAAQAAAREDWQQAQQLYTRARSQWDSQWDAVALAADHGPMEQVDAQFSQLEVYLQQRQQLHFSACAMGLSRLIQAMGEAHSLNLRNLL